MTTFVLRRPSWSRPLMWNTPAYRTDRSAATTNVALNVTEDESGYTVEAFLPGINPADLQIELVDRVLTMSGEFKAQEEVEGVRYHLRERSTGRFERSLRFPTLISGDAIESNYTDGILTIRLPKAESAKPRRIQVQVQPALTEESAN